MRAFTLVAFVVLLGLSSLGRVCLIGQRRPVITPGWAAADLLCNALLIAAVFRYVA